VAGTAIWTDGSRLEDGSAGGAVARHHPKYDECTGARVHMDKNQEVYDAELQAIYRAMLTLFQEPRGQKITIFADALAALQDHIRRTSDMLSRPHNRHTTHGSNGESLSNPMGPQPCRHRRQREGRRVGRGGSTERTRLRATALRVQQHVLGPPEAGHC